jgi:hypothetical protein
MEIIDRSTRRIVLRKVEIASSFFSRLRGYMLRRKPPLGTGLLFKFWRPGRHAIHTFFMRFSLDLVYLDEFFRVIELRENLKPWRIYRSKARVKFLLELPAGSIKLLRFSTGRRLALRKAFNE